MSEGPLSEEDKKLLRDILDKIDTIELVLLALIQSQNEETKEQLLARVGSFTDKVLLDPGPLDADTYRFVNEKLDRVIRFVDRCLSRTGIDPK